MDALLRRGHASYVVMYFSARLCDGVLVSAVPPQLAHFLKYGDAVRLGRRGIEKLAVGPSQSCREEGVPRVQAAG